MPSQIPPIMHFGVPASHSTIAVDQAENPFTEAHESTIHLLMQEDEESGPQSQDDIVRAECWNVPEELASVGAALRHQPGTSGDNRLPDGVFPDFYTPFHYPLGNSGEVPDALPAPRDAFQMFHSMATLAARLQTWALAPTCTNEEMAARLVLGEKILDCSRDGSALLDLAPSGVLSVADLPLAELAPHLKLLFIQGGNLDVLPTEICHLSGLTLLDFSFNRLRALPSRFPHLPNLENLWLRSNLLNAVPQNLQSRLPRLTSLDLENNLFQARSMNIEGLLPFENVSFNGRSSGFSEHLVQNRQNGQNHQNAQAPPSGPRHAASRPAFIRKLEIELPPTTYLRPGGMHYGPFQRFLRARVMLQQSATPCGRILGLYVDSLRRSLENKRIDAGELTLLRHELIDFGAAMACGHASDVASREDLDFRVLDQTAADALGRCNISMRVAGLADLTPAELRLCNPTLLALCKTLVVLSEWHAQDSRQSPTQRE